MQDWNDWSIALQERERCMTTLKDLRLRAHFSKRKLAKETKIDLETITRAETGKRVQEVKVVIILEAINKALKSSYTIADIEGIVTL